MSKQVIMIWALSVVFLVATVGVPIYTHYCLHSNIETISLVSSNENDPCQKNESASCCQKPANTKDCCHDEQTYVSDESIKQEPETEKRNIKSFGYILIKLFFYNIPDILSIPEETSGKPNTEFWNHFFTHSERQILRL